VRRLADTGLVLHEPYGDITLSSTGRKCARRVATRHELLFRFLKDVLGVDATIADEDACRLEHDLSPESVERLTRFMEFLTGGPAERRAWSRKFDEYLAEGKHHADLVGSEVSLPDADAVGEPELRETGGEMADKTLRDVKPKESARVLKVGGSGKIRRRLMDMGLVVGSEITVQRVAPLGDPIEIRLKGYSLTLRKEEAESIVVESLEGAS
jgi:DtxR family Mn-dependent transcriptional regulator